MSPILCLSVLVMLFCTETGALKCYTCDGDDCTKVEECDDRNICMSSTSMHMVGTEPNITRAKFCTTANYCQEIDSIFNHHHVSININSVSIVASVKCCSTDLCNTDNLPGSLRAVQAWWGGGVPLPYGIPLVPSATMGVVTVPEGDALGAASVPCPSVLGSDPCWLWACRRVPAGCPFDAALAVCWAWALAPLLGSRAFFHSIEEAD
ncbi:uncharacterized protein LOC114475300 [Gouania willdenowi]|uniref:uncharacterized protein LOC114475300 n=1 Tax=Gouania willdenowi TaxID=441366 RepID=UPI0010569D91|nr:uncharacterized protein LOC114475300 [Gouania willdenowi]